MYRYLNPGYIDLFKNTPTSSYITTTSSAYTRTGVAFACSSHLYIPSVPTNTKEIWLRYDSSGNSSILGRFRITSSSTLCEIKDAGYNNERIFINNTNTADAPTRTSNAIIPIHIHLKSDSIDGILEIWVGDRKEYEFIGDVLHGEDIVDVSIQSKNNYTDYLFSNIIVSDTAIDMAEQVMAIPCNITTDMTDNGDGTYTATALNQYLRFGIDSSIATTLASGTKITGASLAARSCIRDGEGIETLEAYDGTTLLGSDSIPTTEKAGVAVGVTLDNTVSQFLTHNYELRAK